MLCKIVVARRFVECLTVWWGSSLMSGPRSRSAHSHKQTRECQRLPTRPSRECRHSLSRASSRSSRSSRYRRYSRSSRYRRSHQQSSATRVISASLSSNCWRVWTNLIQSIVVPLTGKLVAQARAWRHGNIKMV